MHSAFPSDERRDDMQQRRNVDCNGRMQCLLIKDGDVNVGFLTIWQLSSISYVEHFAIDDKLRGHGYGTTALDELTGMPDFGRLILEVELPSTEEAIKRITFYEKCGFVLWPNTYVQPPYSSDKQSVPMAIMTYGSVCDSEIEKSIDDMYRFVYNV